MRINRLVAAIGASASIQAVAPSIRAETFRAGRPLGGVKAK
jgi:hypothetical protein